MDEINAEESTDTESGTDSMSDFPVKKELLGGNWVLHQSKGLDDPATDHSDVENVDCPDDDRKNCFEMTKVPSSILKNSETSKVRYHTSSTTNKKPDKMQQRQISLDVPPLKTGYDSSDGESDIEINPTEFMKIIEEELNTRGQTSLTLKSYNSTVSLQKTDIGKEKTIQEESGIDETYDTDDTDCSGVNVSMFDYYAIRHQNQPTIHEKKVAYDKKSICNREPNTEDEEIDVNSSVSCSKKEVARRGSDSTDVSDLDVNIRDYYAIRYEQGAMKGQPGPFEIDFGQTTLQCSSFKSTKKKRAHLIPMCPIENEARSTDNEDISGYIDDLMLCNNLAHSPKQSDVKNCKSSQPNSVVFLDNQESKHYEREEECSESESSESIVSVPTEGDAEDIPVDVSSKLTRNSRSIIRMIEVDGCQGAIGIICEPESPRRDDVYGIRFLDTDMDKTEIFANLSDAEEDAEFMEKGNYAPATDDEELSELEDDTKHIAAYILPECRKKVCQIKTTLDGKTVSVENLVKLDQAVNLQQFVKETESLSESDVNDWPEHEARIARKMSGDFGKIRVSPVPASSLKVQTTQAVKANSNPKKGSRTRKRGRKRSDARDTKSNA